MRRFVKPNSSQETSPILVTILGTYLPDSVKIWFINQKIQPFIDRLRQCTKCFSFFHPIRVCEKSQACHLCGTGHVGPCQGPAKCINCQGPHSATSKTCPMYSKEQQMLELKSRKHLTTGEARCIFSHASNATYATAVKSNMIRDDFESIVDQKIESILQSLLQKMQKQTLTFQEKMEQVSCLS
ncbi:hypothetical protein AVEN_41839-1 [Araneus ventricosus]|uniref:Nucleic-acid-binding protein from mobile element jockey n=1 Tax=Araneus ventricosus TaxID=182803 RepID=A0A4Y2ACX1_ARAVE|nr:hypothetical protein AVEN_41839-1 [Araneus ventricosus]